MTGLMKLIPRHIPLRERCIAGWEKLHRKPTQNHLQEAVRVFQIKEVGIPEYQRDLIDSGHQRTQDCQRKRDRRTGKISWVDGWSFTLAGKISDPEWSSSYGNEREASKGLG